MKLVLKEDPAEWRKFAAVISGMILTLLTVAWFRGRLPLGAWLGAGGIVGALLVAGLIFPGWLRRPYRVGMTGFFHFGQFMGRIILGVVFLVVVTPLGLILRGMRKDLLSRRIHPDPDHSYWIESQNPGPLDRMF